MHEQSRLDRVLNLVLGVTFAACAYVLVSQLLIPRHFWEERNLPGRSARVAGLEPSGKTYVVALSASCSACRKSLPFIRQLSAEAQRRRVKMLLVMSDEAAKIEKFMGDNDLRFDQFRSASPAVLGVNSVPSVLSVDAQARIDKAWISVEGREDKILAHLVE